jgi:hypothetical protein
MTGECLSNTCGTATVSSLHRAWRTVSWRHGNTGPALPHSYKVRSLGSDLESILMSNVVGAFLQTRWLSGFEPVPEQGRDYLADSEPLRGICSLKLFGLSQLLRGASMVVSDEVLL